MNALLAILFAPSLAGIAIGASIYWRNTLSDRTNL